MGIKNLKSIVERHAPEVREQHTIDYFTGSTFAIDSSIFLYRFLYSKGHLEHPHVVGFLNKIIYFLKNGIIPLFIWDGIPPQQKEDVLSKRWENKKKLEERIAKLNEKIDELKESITIIEDDDEDDSLQHGELPILPKQEKLDKFIENQEKLRVYQNEVQKLSKQIIYVKKHHKEDVKNLLNILGIPNLSAKGEAEALCSEMVKQNIVDFALSEDTDTLVHGSPNLLQNGKKNDEFILTRLDNLLQGFKFSFNQFMDFCILCGCDYTCTIPKLGPVTAFNYIKEWGSIENMISNMPQKFNVPEDFDYKTSRKLFIDSPSIPPGWEVQHYKIGNIDDWEKNFTQFMSDRQFNNYQIQKYIQELKSSFREIKKHF